MSVCTNNCRIEYFIYLLLSITHHAVRIKLYSILQYSLNTTRHTPPVHKYFCIHSTVDLKAPSLPAFTIGSLISPRTANPCLHPGKYSRLYPGANLPSPKITSALACASAGNMASSSHELIRKGALDTEQYFYERKLYTVRMQED